MLTVHDRFLLPANPSIGVLHHRGKYYGFSNKEAADDFAGNPEGSVIVGKFDNAVSTFCIVHCSFSTYTVANYCIWQWQFHVEKEFLPLKNYLTSTLRCVLVLYT